jgi:hypothetical protein
LQRFELSVQLEEGYAVNGTWKMNTYRFTADVLEKERRLACEDG